jgi:Chalcone isomerase-like
VNASKSRSYALYLIAACALFYWAGAVFASQKAAAPPVEVASYIPDVRSIGSTRLKVLGFQIYDARLWAEPDFQPTAYDESRFALEITYLRSFDNNAVADRSIKEMRKLGKFSDTQQAQWLAQMRAIFPDIAKGDRLTGIHQPGVGAAFSFNGKPIGEIKDAEFARLFFGIWLSPQTSAPEMRRELLGLAGHKP